MLKCRISVLAAAAAGLFAFTTVAEAADSVTWNFSFWGKRRAVMEGMEKVTELVEQRSGGKFKIKIHYGEALSKAKENLDGIKLGAFQMAGFCASYHPAKTPTISALDLPFLPFANFDIQKKVHEAFFQQKAVLADLKRWNALPYMSAILPQYEFMGRGEPPLKIKDWEGKRVRALGGLGKAMAALGAVPTTVPAPETYQLLERGAVDAVSWPFTYAHAAFKVDEISEWFTGNLAPGAVTCPLVMNKTAWEKLPKEYQDLMMGAKEEGYAALKAAYQAADDKNLPRFRAKMKEIIYSEEALDEFRKVAGKPVWDAWVKEMDALGVPAQQLLDFIFAEAKKAKM